MSALLSSPMNLAIRKCGTLPISTQDNLRSQLNSLQSNPFYQSGFQNNLGQARLESLNATFVQPGQIPQPGQLLSLRHTEYSQSFANQMGGGMGMGFGGMDPAALGRSGIGGSQFAQALQFALAQQLGMMPFGMNWLQGGMGMGMGMGRMNGMGHAFGGAGGCFGSYGQQMGALSGMNQALQSQLALGALGYNARQGAMGAVGGMGQVNPQRVSMGAGQAASFPVAGKSEFLGGLTDNAKNAKMLNVSGTKDVQRINKAIGQLNTAEPKISLAKAGEKGGPGKLVLSQEQVTAIRNAPDQKAAEAIVRQAIGQQTGKKLGTENMNDKNAIRKTENREAMNALLGTKVRPGREKNSGSSLVLNEMVANIAKSVRGGNFGSTTVQHDYARSMVGDGCSSAFGMFRMGSTTAEFANAPSALSVDLDGYKAAAQSVGELASPLIFDLEGQGLVLKNGGMIDIDIDGDGKYERVTELDAHIGLLVFDSKFVPEDGEDYGVGRDMFGDGTDLSHYGIRGSKDDGTFANGFEALRALAEHFELVHGDKQHLAASDLALLEREVGLAMRVGGVAEGEDQSFAQIGISQINLGDPDAIQDIEDSQKDHYGNRYMKQDGATFVVNGDTRDYCDIWFSIQARTEIDDFADDASDMSAATLLAMHRRI